MWVKNINLTVTCSVNDDGIMPVDLAAMLGHTEVVKLLQSKGAKDSPKCRSCRIWLGSPKIDVYPYTITSLLSLAPT